MKRKLLIAAALLLLPMAAFAGSYYSAGASGVIGKSGDAGIVGGAGIYFDTYYAYKKDEAPLAHGFGMALECDIPVNARGVLLNMLSGWAMEWDISGDGFAELYTLLGPSFSCSIGRSENNFISIGAGIGITGNFYFNENRTLGLNVGIRGVLEGTNFHDSVKGNVKPAGWFGAHVGFSCKIGQDYSQMPAHSYVVAPEFDEEKK